VPKTKTKNVAHKKFKKNNCKKNGSKKHKNAKPKKRQKNNSSFKNT
jgi:hypothetical protein